MQVILSVFCKVSLLAENLAGPGCRVQASNQPCRLGQMYFIVIIILYQQSKGIDFSQASYVLTQPIGSCPAEPFRAQS